MILPTSIATYRRADLPGLRLLNMYAEAAQKVPGNVILLPRPGMAQRETIGEGPFAGLFHQPGAFGDAVFSVSGSGFYGNSTSLGSVSVVGLSQMAVADNALLAATGGGFYRYDGSALASVAFPDNAGVSSVVFLGGYAFAARRGTRRFYFSGDAGATWDGLDYLSAEQSTDYIVGLAIVVDQLWVFCQRHTEVFFLTGDDEAPVQRVQGRVFDKGALARDTIVRLDNTVFWVGHDGIVYRGEQTPQRVSDHGIEERIGLSSPALSAWSYAWNGHLFYVLHLDAETLVYDVATQQWHEAGSYGGRRWRALIGVQVGRDVVVADDESNQLWTLEEGRYSDGEDELERLFTASVDEPGFIDMMALDCSCGEAPINEEPGVLEMRTSRDNGNTFGEWRQKSLGLNGQYRKRVGFNRVGMVDRGNMLIQFRVTDPRASRISNVRVNEGRGGRARV